MPLPNPLRFEPIEAFANKLAVTFPPVLQISPTPIYYKSLLLRLLLGTINIRCNKTNKVIKQRNNYTTLTFTRNSRLRKSILTTAISPQSLTEYNSFILATNANNLKFYTELYYEFSSYFFNRSENNELAAFVNLYRILEKIAYCFPLLWAARAKHYENTFAKLRAYFSDPKIGELGVFKKYIDDSVDLAFKLVSTTLQIQSIHPDWQQRYYDILINLLDPNDITNNIQPHRLDVRFRAFVELLIKVRNKYFHALTGFSNSFSCEQIVDANEFLGIINESIANWLSFLIFQIFEFELAP